ncbi:MAG: hypothetical protein N4A38_04735 [Candidatus Gracilibacteria bacterium]|nr:hypothetical protein [Candidatus Gracilibacteria bacterium]
MRNHSALNKYWWHRLIKVIFYIITIIIFLVSFLIFYSQTSFAGSFEGILEKLQEKKLNEILTKEQVPEKVIEGYKEWGMSDYEINQLFKKEYTRGDFYNLNDEIKLKIKNGKTINDDILTKYSVEPKTINLMYEYGLTGKEINAFFDGKYTRGEFEKYIDKITKEISDKKQKKLEKELNEKKFWNGIKNFFLNILNLIIILLKSFLITGIWIILSLLFYYKGIIYIIFGDKEIK